MKTRAELGFVELGDFLSEEESKQVFSHFGLAVHVSNVLEFSTLQAVFTVELVQNRAAYGTRADWEAAYDRFFEEGLKDSFGKNVGRLRESGKYSKELNKTLDACVVVRNNLIHHFQRDSAELFFSASGRVSLVESYENAVALFSAAYDQLEVELREQQAIAGVDAARLADLIEQGMRELIA